MNVCDTCGLPKELCVCESIAKESQKITISLEKKKFGKNYTIVKGFEGKEIDLEQLAKKLKAKLACGGTVKDGRIELQGEHKKHVREILFSMGFAPDTIVIR